MVPTPPDRRALPEPDLRLLRTKYELRGLVESEPPREAFLRIARVACEGLREMYEFSPAERDIRDMISSAIANDDRFLRHLEKFVDLDSAKIDDLAAATAGTVIQVCLESQEVPELPMC